MIQPAKPVKSAIFKTGSYDGFNGGIRTEKVGFTLSKNFLALYQVGGPNGTADWQDEDGRLGVPRGTVNDRMAYELARGWLEALGVNMAEMEKVHRPHVQHWKVPVASRKTVGSRFKVSWGERRGSGPGSLAVQEVLLDASKKRLAHLDLTDLSFYRHPLPRIPHEIPISLLPDEPVRKFFQLRPGEPSERIFKGPLEVITNALRLLEVPPEYEREGRVALLAHVRVLCAALGWDKLEDFQDRNLTEVYVTPPAFGLGGRIAFQHAEVQFDSSGRLRLAYIRPDEFVARTNIASWAQTAQSVVSSSQAYTMTTQRLAAVSIDVHKLNQDHEWKFHQAQGWRQNKKGERTYFDAALFWLEWRDPGSQVAIARVCFRGDTITVAHIELNNTSYYLGPLACPPGATRPRMQNGVNSVDGEGGSP